MSRFSKSCRNISMICLAVCHHPVETKMISNYLQDWLCIHRDYTIFHAPEKQMKSIHFNTHCNMLYSHVYLMFYFRIVCWPNTKSVLLVMLIAFNVKCPGMEYCTVQSHLFIAINPSPLWPWVVEEDMCQIDLFEHYYY